jgi:hypothetical protein
VYCGLMGGAEMCFTRSKFVLLFAVSGGVVWYGISTNRRETKGPQASVIGYERIDDADGIEIEAIQSCPIDSVVLAK